MKTFSSPRRELLTHALTLTAGSAALMTLSRPSQAQSHAQAQTQSPTVNSIQRVLCGAPPGSIPDIIARRYAERLSTQTGAGVIVENRAGAAGQIAVTALKQASADGATVLLAHGAVATIYPSLYSKLNYDPVADLKPVSMAAEMNLAIAVGPVVPESVRSVRDLLDWSRTNPKQATYASPGAGTLPHLVSAMLFREAKLEWQHVPYPGGPPAIVDLIGGRIAALALPEGLLRPHHQAGKLRVLAHSGPTTSKFLPDVPSFTSQGFPSLVIREWFSFFMPGGTAQMVVDAASQTIRAAAAGAGVETALNEMGMIAVAGTPAALSERIATEHTYWQKFLSASGIRAE